MAQRPTQAIDFDDDASGGSLLGRALLWAGLAAIAIGSVVLATQSQTGGQRVARMLGDDPGPVVSVRAAPPPATTRPPEHEAESRRLAEAVRLLAADRDRLLARLDQLERVLDVTASTPRESAAAAAHMPLSAPVTATNWSFGPDLPAAAGVPSLALAPVKTVPPPEPPAHAGSQLGNQVGNQVATQPARANGGLMANEQGAESVATRTEFGIDIGGDATLDGLRALWASLRNSNPAQLEGLRPLVAVRETGKPGAVELRLLVGPFVNAGAAARLCAALAGNGLPCQPTVFDGQRLALR
jgi:hypothetical protein